MTFPVKNLRLLSAMDQTWHFLHILCVKRVDWFSVLSCNASMSFPSNFSDLTYEKQTGKRSHFHTRMCMWKWSFFDHSTYEIYGPDVIVFTWNFICEMIHIFRQFSMNSTTPSAFRWSTLDKKSFTSIFIKSNFTSEEKHFLPSVCYIK